MFLPFVTASSLIAFAASVQAAPSPASGCTAQINSLDDVAAAQLCTTIKINSFTVPPGKTFTMDKLLDGTNIELMGDLDWAGGEFWEGNLFYLKGAKPANVVNFEGHGHQFNGHGEFYWDGLGGNGGFKKPKFVRINTPGTFTNLKVINAPRHCFSIGNTVGSLDISHIHFDNSAGNAPNAQSNGLPAAHNSDAFDVSAYNVVIRDSHVTNQDDCLAVNKGSNIEFRGNHCSGGHGVSIGSVKTGQNVDNVRIINNQITDNTNGLRIKTYVGATDASVSNIYYENNHVKGATEFGVTIRQDYRNEGPSGTPSSDVPITGVIFGPGNKVESEDSAVSVQVLCGETTCTGFDFSGLKTKGGQAPQINIDGVKGFKKT